MKNKNEEAINIVRRALVSAEARVVELQKRVAEFDYELGSPDRDQLIYVMGRAAQCRDILMCMGERKVMSAGSAQ